MQQAILCFRDYKDKDLISGITQPSNIGSHQNLNGATDFNGRNAQDQVDLLAPYDCKVMAIGRADNTVFFESIDDVETPIGIYKCWFMCTHMNDNDFNRYGMKVGKTFKQGEACYTEGSKSYGKMGAVGLHIHMEQGTGRFGGGSSPYYKSNDTYYYNGKKYYTYYPVVKDGWEMPVYDMFYLKDVEVVWSSYEKQNGHKFYEGKWKTLGQVSQVPPTSVGDKEIKKMQEMIIDLQGQVKDYQKKIDDIKKVLGV